MLQLYHHIKHIHAHASRRPKATTLLLIAALLASAVVASTTAYLAIQVFALVICCALSATLAVIHTVQLILRYLIPKVQFNEYASLYQSKDPIVRAPRSLDQLRVYISEIHERYNLLTTNVAASIIIQRNNGEIVFCSPYTQVLTGYSSEEVSSLSPDDFYANLLIEEDRERYQRAKQVAAIGEDILVRIRIIHRSGIALWLEIRLVPICDAHGETVAIMTVANDVTDSLNYQKLIEQQNQDLNDFSYMISHDLKSPIFTIKGMSTALKEDYSSALGEEGNALLKFISDAANRLERLVSSLLEYSALSIANDEESNVNLEQVLNAVLSDCSQQIKDADVIIERKGQLPQIHGPELRLYQVFSNLISNAIKYRDKSRQLTITISAAETVPGFALVAVRDNGQGIAPGKIDSIFRAFHRAHGAEIEGSGIGLACVKKIVDRIGGSVSVESKVGVGSVFLLTLPLPLPAPQSVPKHLEKAYSAKP